ncbi:MAG: ABC transporter permease [Candidatus Nitrosopolaris wilkensis]|nr:MAG: ABC transporter permease [Candidatus Nitrosopolaris wilkensis]
METEDVLRKNGNSPITNRGNRSSPISVINKKKQKKHYHRNLKQIFLLSFDTLIERKARSALTILMVVVGSGLMVALNGMSAGQTDFINKSLNTLAPNVLFVTPGQIGFRGPTEPPTIIFNSEVVNRIKSLPYVQDVVPAYQGQLQLSAQGNFLNAQVFAYKPEKIYLSYPSLELVGRSSIQPNNPSAILVGDSLANPPGKTTPFVSIGQTVKATYSSVDPDTGKIKTQSRSFVVSGIMQPTGNNQLDKAVIINELTGNSLFHKAGKYDTIEVAAISGDYVNVVQQEIASLYGSNNIGVITPKAIMQTLQHTQSGSSSFTLEIAFIALLVGAIGIVTTLYTSENERIKEIGTMKAIGAKPWFILSMFLSEAVLIGLIGSTLGIFTGVGVTYLLTSGFGGSTPGGGPPGAAAPHISPIFLPNDLLYVWFLSLSISLVAGVYPAWKASRLSPLEALRR